MADADAMHRDGREVIRLVTSAFSKCGRMVNINIKGWRYNDDFVHWEVRSIFETIFKGTDFDVAKIMKEQMGCVDAFLQQMGTKLWKEFTPSSKAYTSNTEFYDTQGTDVERIRFEYAATTLGVMALLFVWSQTRRYRDKQFTSLAMLDAIVSLTLDAKHFFNNACEKKYARELDACIERSSLLKPCRHVKYVWRHLASNYESWSWKNFIEVLVELWVNEEKCGAYDDLLDVMFHNIRDHVEEYCTRTGAADPLRDTQVFRTISGKRRRMDEDLRASLGSMAVDGGVRAGSAVKLLDCGGQRCPYDAMLRKVKELREASRATMRCTGVVSMADDGSNHGKPAESTLLSLLWDYEANVGIAGQPMVSSYQLWRDNLTPTSLNTVAKYAHLRKGDTITHTCFIVGAQFMLVHVYRCFPPNIHFPKTGPKNM